MRTAIRTCPLCEATCGLAIEVADDGTVGKVRGDAQDVLSKGFVCPKGVALRELHEDPDRLRAPVVRQADGSFAEVTWDEAFAEVARRLGPVLEAHGKQAVATYLGNPSAHALGAMLYSRVLVKAIGSTNVFSASTVDQFPMQVAGGLMFGTAASVPVPDLDRCRYLVVLGANPAASNGSLMTAPDVRGRLRAIRERGGTVVVVDPRRTRTVDDADLHLAIRPGTDALFLLGLACTLFDEGLVRLGRAEGLVRGLDELRELALAHPPEATAAATGLDPELVRGVARGLAAAPGGACAVYGRIGTTTQRFGAVTSWLIEAVTTLAGGLDSEGGARFTTPAAGSPHTSGEPGRGRGLRLGRWRSRVRDLPEVLGELPAVTLADEVLTPGEGQVRALFTIAGNPAVSVPGSERIAEALASLDCFVAVDPYLNETTRHAHVVLPPPSSLERSHFDVLLYGFAVRDVANYSAPVLERSGPDEWEVLLRLTGIVSGLGPDADVAALDAFVARAAVERECGSATSPLSGGDVDAVLAALEPRIGPERLLDLMLRCGPYGAGVPELGLPGRGAAREDGGLTLAVLEASPHGVDLGALKARLPEVLRTPDGLIDLAPAALLADAEQLGELLDDPDGLVLIGRRHLRSNNSWMHNLPLLARGPERCTLLVHPADAERLELRDGERAVVTSRGGSVEAPVEVSDEIREGVVSLPHGWGHDAPGAQLAVAAQRPGVNSNVLGDPELLEPLSGTAVLNGIPVVVAPVRDLAGTAG